MATRHFENASMGAFSESLLPLSLLMSGHAARLSLIRPQAKAIPFRWDSPPAPREVETGNIGRCLRWALAIEGAAAVAVYAVWVLARFVR